MLILSPKVRALLTLVAAVLAAVVPLLAHSPALAVVASTALTVLAAIGIIPSHLEVSTDE